jgi:hypothetical protein
MTSDQLAAMIKEKLRRPEKITSRKLCLDDLAHNVGVFGEFLEIVSALRQLVGRTVKSVEFDNTATLDENPMGNIGQFIIYLEP